MKTPLTQHMSRKGLLLLAASVALNLIAGTLLLTRSQNQTHQVLQAIPPPSTTVSHDASPGQEAPPASHAPETSAFHWRQLDAPDFQTFVANLRNIGCPEATIRDIITGELKEIYDLKRIRTSSDGSCPPDSGSAEHASREENASAKTGASEMQRVIDQLLGTASDTAGMNVAVVTVAPVSQAATTVTDVADVPAAFIVGNAPGQRLAGTGELATTVTDPNLDSEMAEQLNRMRNDFAAAVTETSNDTAPYSDSSTSSSISPAGSDRDYYRRWLKAKRDSDEVFSSMYGGDALIRVQQQALFEASAQAAAVSLGK